MNEVLQIIASLWPIGIGVITLIIVLARMHYNLEAPPPIIAMSSGVICF